MLDSDMTATGIKSAPTNDPQVTTNPSSSLKGFGKSLLDSISKPKKKEKAKTNE
jgi:hypothetical protein